MPETANGSRFVFEAPRLAVLKCLRTVSNLGSYFAGPTVSDPTPVNESLVLVFEGIEEIVGSVLTFKPLLQCEF